MAIDPNNLSATATLTFDDEFNTLNLWNGTSGTWSTQYWFNSAANGGSLNDEQEWYINPAYAPTSSVKPWTVTNGILSLTAAKADPSIQPYINNYQYTSGMVTSQHSFSQTYGYFEIRAQLPAGQGFWPAFWLLPTDQSWPPEIDVFEMLGKDPSTIYTTVHSGPTNVAAGTGVTVANTSTGFHTYGVDWEPDYLTWYFDGQQVFKTATPADVNKPMYLLANLGLGGGWGGPVDSTTPFPGAYQIDYIRAYSAGASSTPPPVTPPPVTPPPSSTPPPPSLLFTLPASGAWTNTINGTSHNDRLSGTSANDYIDGKSGVDVMKGGLGDDTYVVDRYNDSVVENASAGIDTVLSKATTFTLPANVENLTLSGTVSQTGIGNSLNNILTSNDAGSKLSGGDGNDILIAGRGADTLTGGVGTDIFQFDHVPTSAGHVTDFTLGSDMLDLRGLFSAVGYTGSNPVADHYLSFASDGAGGTKVMFDPDGPGAAGSSLITTLDHIAPTSLTMGTDWYFQTASSSPPTTGTGTTLQLFSLPFTGTGVQTLSSNAPTVTLTDGWQNLVLNGTAAQAGTGNNLNNIVISNVNYDSTLNGGDGNDILKAGYAHDILTGGAGSDIFEFDYLPWNPGHITDFTSGVDMLDLRPLFQAVGYTGTDPIKDGYLSFQSDGAGNTQVNFDPHNPSEPWARLITTLDHFSPTTHIDWFYH